MNQNFLFEKYWDFAQYKVILINKLKKKNYFNWVLMRKNSETQLLLALKSYLLKYYIDINASAKIALERKWL